MRDHEHRIIAVMQLLNAQDEHGAVVAFDDADQRLAESLASQAAMRLSNRASFDDQSAPLRILRGDDRRCHR